MLGQSWEQTYIEMCLYGLMHCDMPSANNVWGAYLRSKGWERKIIPNECPDCYCVKSFCEDYPSGRYIMAISGHVVAVIDGDYYDTWDSGDEVPVYYWERKD